MENFPMKKHNYSKWQYDYTSNLMWKTENEEKNLLVSKWCYSIYRVWIFNSTKRAESMIMRCMFIVYPFTAGCCQMATFCQYRIRIYLKAIRYSSWSGLIINYMHFRAIPCLFKKREIYCWREGWILPPTPKTTPESKWSVFHLSEHLMREVIISG
jgi:hypothetical protein